MKTNKFSADHFEKLIFSSASTFFPLAYNSKDAAKFQSRKNRKCSRDQVKVQWSWLQNSLFEFLIIWFTYFLQIFLITGKIAMQFAPPIEINRTWKCKN